MLTEIPALVGIVFLAPWRLLVAIVFGHLAASAQRRRPPIKAIPSLLVYAASAALGILFYDWAIGDASPVSPRGWAVAIGTITLINLVDLVILLALMAVVEPSLAAATHASDDDARRRPRRRMLGRRPGGRLADMGEHVGSRLVHRHRGGGQFRLPRDDPLGTALRQPREALRVHPASRIL